MFHLDYICMSCGNEFRYNPEKRKCPNCESEDISIITDTDQKMSNTKRQGNHNAYEGTPCRLCSHDLLDHIVRDTTNGYRIGCIAQGKDYHDNCECNAGIVTEGDKGRDSQLQNFLDKIIGKK